MGYVRNGFILRVSDLSRSRAERLDKWFCDNGSKGYEQKVAALQRELMTEYITVQNYISLGKRKAVIQNTHDKREMLKQKCNISL